MNYVYNLKHLRMARIFARDLDFLIENTQLQINKYKEYSKYSSVQKILYTLEEELGILRAQRNKCKNIIDSKGKVIHERS